MTQFVAYFVVSPDDDEPLPIATGHSEDEAMMRAMQRMAAKHVDHGGLLLYVRDDMDPKSFALLAFRLDAAFGDTDIGAKQ